MNGVPTTFDSTIRTKQQAQINFKMCCDEIASFDVVELMRSQYGWGKITNATYSSKTEVMSVDLIHE